MISQTNLTYDFWAPGLGCTAESEKPQQWEKEERNGWQKVDQLPCWSCRSAGSAGNANRKQTIHRTSAGKWCWLMLVERAVLSSVSTSRWRRKTKAFQAELVNEGKSKRKFPWQCCQDYHDRYWLRSQAQAHRVWTQTFFSQILSTQWCSAPLESPSSCPCGGLAPLMSQSNTPIFTGLCSYQNTAVTQNWSGVWPIWKQALRG